MMTLALITAETRCLILPLNCRNLSFDLPPRARKNPQSLVEGLDGFKLKTTEAVNP